MGYWRRHQKPELEALLVEFDAAGWRVEATRRYYQVKCPCGEHLKTVHLSPSDPNYKKNTTGWLHRQPCYRDKDSGEES